MHPASDGEEAARLFREHAETIGLLLTDLTMPGKDGVELAMELTRLCPTLPVVFMSGNYLQWQEKRQQARNKGANAVFVIREQNGSALF